MATPVVPNQQSGQRDRAVEPFLLLATSAAFETELGQQIETLDERPELRLRGTIVSGPNTRLSLF